METQPTTRSASAATRVGESLRKRSNWAQLAKFCAVGAVGYVVNLAVYALLLKGADLHYLWAAIGSFLVAVLNNYLLNRLWTFRHVRGDITRQAARFLVVSTIALGGNLGVLHLLVQAGLGEILAQAIAIVIVTPLNFVGNKLWSFRRTR